MCICYRNCNSVDNRIPRKHYIKYNIVIEIKFKNDVCIFCKQPDTQFCFQFDHDTYVSLNIFHVNQQCEPRDFEP